MCYQWLLICRYESCKEYYLLHYFNYIFEYHIFLEPKYEVVFLYLQYHIRPNLHIIDMIIVSIRVYYRVFVF